MRGKKAKQERRAGRRSGPLPRVVTPWSEADAAKKIARADAQAELARTHRPGEGPVVDAAEAKRARRAARNKALTR